MLRTRVLFANIVLLLLTIFGAFVVISTMVLRPMITSLNEERAELAVYLIEQAEQAPNVERRLNVLARRVRLQAQVLDELPQRGKRHIQHAQHFQIESHDVYVFPGANTPIVTNIHTDAGVRWALVKFPVDLEKPPKRVGLGLLLLGGVAVLMAWLMTRWVLRPLELAGDGMARMSAGELGFRLPHSQDITGRIGKTFNHMAERIEGLVEGQRQMMAAVSHEVRTPLARLRLHTELLRDSGVADERIHSIEQSIEEIDSLIDELLESARLEQGAMALHVAEMSVESLFSQALAEVDLGERPVSLQVASDLTLIADEARMLRVCRNLLTNIARYTPPDSAVSLSAQCVDAQRVRLVIADRGPGVSPAALSKLFDPFYRTESSRSRTTGGLGLGLMLVRQIVHAHGGEIEAANRSNGGLTISIWLPCEPPKGVV